MKDKNVATLLAIFLGWAGVHRFYLGQVGLGIFYCIMMFTGISFILMIIDFIAFLTMDKDLFDIKYNRHILDPEWRERPDFERRHPRREARRDYRGEREQQRQERRQQDVYRKTPPPPPSPPRRKTLTPPPNPYKTSGIRKYKEFEYEDAIEDFLKALTVDAKDVAVHFNLACAYSLIEQKENSFFHLSKAVDCGFEDFEKINTHDALAFLRIQDEFDTFVDNEYRLVEEDISSPIVPPQRNPQIDTNKDLLEQLKQLGELREKGLLTEEEFQMQKKKILG